MVDESFAGGAEDLDAARLRARNWVVIPPSEGLVSSESLRDEEEAARVRELAEALCDLHVLGRSRGARFIDDALYAEKVRDAEERAFRAARLPRPRSRNGH